MSSTYFLYQTQLVNLRFDDEDALCLVGYFIQDTTLRSRQTFDEEKGLVENEQEMATATSSIFALVLSNHKLLYYHQTPSAPGIGTFRTVAERNIRLYYTQYKKDALEERVAQLQAEGKITTAQARQTKRDIRQSLPPMSLEIIPMASEDDFAKFIGRLGLLTSIRIQLIDTNAENDSDPFFDEMREKKDEVNSEKTSLTHENRTGLDKERAAAQLTAAVAQGISRVSFRGVDAAGDGIIGNESNFMSRISRLVSRCLIPTTVVSLTVLTIYSAVCMWRTGIFGRKGPRMMKLHSPTPKQRKPRLALSETASTSAAADRNRFNPAELTREKTLWAVWQQSRRIKDSKFVLYSTGAVFFLSLAYALATPLDGPVLADRVRGWSDFGLNFAAALLGFLIAGFTIFATLSKPELFIEMAKRTEKATGLSYLKSHFFNFMKTFAVYFFFVCTCFLIKFFAAQDGPLSVLIAHLPTYPTESKRLLAQIGLVFIGTSFFYLIVLLQEFIFNVYHAVMTSLRWAAEYSPPADVPREPRL